MPPKASARGRPSSTRRTYAAGARSAGAPRGSRSGKGRFTAVRILLVGVLAIAGLKLVSVQAFEAEALSAKAEQQRTTQIDIPARRGAITDRNGSQLAFSVEVRTLTANLRLMRKNLAEAAQKTPGAPVPTFEQRATEIAGFIASKVPDKADAQELMTKFNKTGADGKPASFTYLVDEVEPSIADEIKEKYPEIDFEKRASREYPGGTLAADVLGTAKWRMEDKDVSKHNLEGLAGLESVRDDDLAGTSGKRLVSTEQGKDSVVIPGTERDLQPAVAGSDVELTIDSDLQYDLQRKVTDYVKTSRAKGGSAIVMDSKTGEVYALANDTVVDPNNPDAAKQDLSNRAVSLPFEPGSVNKIVAATAAIDSGIATPESTMPVPGSLPVADHVVHDAWSHGTLNFSTTGIFAKSSNVGTLMLARKIGEDKYADLLTKFGIGQRTGMGLPGESPGAVPPRKDWSGTTFGNLPIGQGLSMTVAQMAGMYQAIANEGLRVEPRIVKGTVQPDGSRVPEPPPKTTQVVSPQTANTVKDMLRAVTQKEKGQNSGTAPAAALEGYQVSGKTGTGQQVDPKTGAYSDQLYNITFAGILPADNPRFVVGIRLDAPETTLPEGHSAAPLFHDIASYLAQRFNLPLSDQPTPVVPLVM